MTSQIDIEKFIRLRSTIRAVTAAPTITGAAEEMLIHSYVQIRSEVRSMLTDENVAAEFEALCPEGPTATGSGSTSRALEAVALLRQMAGWLDGLIEVAERSAQITANAEAYARAQLKAERGVGF